MKAMFVLMVLKNEGIGYLQYTADCERGITLDAIIQIQEYAKQQDKAITNALVINVIHLDEPVQAAA
jgi:hypothetical protein